MYQVQRASVMALLVIALALSVCKVADAEQLVHGYYRKSWKISRRILGAVVLSFLKALITSLKIIFSTLRHDCFVRGCDASVLLAGPGTERTAATNTSLHGFEAMDQITAAVEKACPNTVSCADILAYASHDTVILTGGKSWKVPTGRRDGVVSLEVEVDQNLPPSSAKAQELISNFAQKGLTP